MYVAVQEAVQEEDIGEAFSSCSVATLCWGSVFCRDLAAGALGVAARADGGGCDGTR